MLPWKLFQPSYILLRVHCNRLVPSPPNVGLRLLGGVPELEQEQDEVNLRLASALGPAFERHHLSFHVSACIKSQKWQNLNPSGYSVLVQV